MTLFTLHKLVTRSGRRLKGAQSGVALVEFALGLPIVLAMGAYGIELSNQAIVNLRISQIALNLADNASRVGLNNGLSTVQLRDSDINDVLAAAQIQGAGIKLTTYGRITLSSLENVAQSYDNGTAVQRIHWQRCLGANNSSGYGSSYGTTTTTAGSDATQANAGTTATSGMGSPLVSAPSGSGLMYVEINYLYQPIFGTLLIKPMRIHYTASFIVRDKRDFSQIFANSPKQTASTCNLYSASPPAVVLS